MSNLDKKLERVFNRTFSKVGQDFFQELVASLAKELSVKVVMITKYVNRNPHTLKSLSAWVDGTHIDSFTYHAEGTPCFQVVANGSVCYQSGLKKKYPKDEFVLNFDLDSYLGLSITDESQTMIGHLCILDNKPLLDVKYKEFILKLFAARASAELCRISYEEKILNYRNKLEQEIKDRTRELQKSNSLLKIKVEEKVLFEKKLLAAKARAESANEAKSLFLANISHEIRTPLAAISGFVDLALKKEEPEKTSFLKIIKKNSEHLSSIVNDLLDLSKIESGQLDVHCSFFSLVGAIETVLASIEPMAQNKDLKLEVRYKGKIPESIYSDPQKFRQILINILTNSIKFTQKGKILVVVRVDKKNDNRPFLRVTVKDSGDGISPEMHKKLFIPFVRGKNNGETDGLGVGLALSKRLAQYLGGDLRLIKSKEGEGSIFEFFIFLSSFENKVLDRNYPELGAEVQTSNFLDKSDVPLAGLSIMVVDDSRDMRLLIHHMINQKGGNVTLCSSGEEAIELISIKKFDLVFMDIRMPQMSGDETLKRIKSFDKETPIVALTAHALEEEKNRCLEIGFDGFLTKPFDEEKLFGAILKYASNRKKYYTELDIDALELKKAYEAFYEDIQKSFNALHKAYTEKNIDQLKTLSHKIKGSSACFRYNNLAQLADSLNREANEKIPNFKNIEHLMGALCIEYRKVDFDFELYNQRKTSE